MPIPHDRFSEIAINFVGPLPKSKGFNMLAVITDRLTNYVRIEPTHQTATATDIAELIHRSWYRHFGIPSAITSDRDKVFTSKFWKELLRILKVHPRMSTSRHPETDGSSERSNKTAIESLRHYVNARQSDWADHLIAIEIAMNNSVNATTSKTPTELLYGTPIRLFPRVAPPGPDSQVPAVNEYIDRI
jgi:hypothetical protein